LWAFSGRWNFTNSHLLHKHFTLSHHLSNSQHPPHNPHTQPLHLYTNTNTHTSQDLNTTISTLITSTTTPKQCTTTLYTNHLHHTNLTQPLKINTTLILPYQSLSFSVHFNNTSISFSSDQSWFFNLSHPNHISSYQYNQ
jgi:hypothetical protein